MSDWPELERRLLESGRRRTARRWRSWTRIVLVPAAVVLAVVTVVVVSTPSTPSDERAVVPADSRDQPSEPTGPGIHDTAVDVVRYGDTSLSAGTANRLGYVNGQGFTVSVVNPGENDEVNVGVSVRIRPAGGGEAITLTRMLPGLAAGGETTIELPLDREPPLGRALTVDVELALVPGETNADNNRSSYPVLFDDLSEDAEPDATATPGTTDTAVTPVPVAELRDTEAVQADLASGGELARAWKVPALKGHVHLIRTSDGWCLSVPDPLTNQPEIERGKTCTDSAKFTDRGIQIGIGSTSVSVESGADAPLVVKTGGDAS